MDSSSNIARSLIFVGIVALLMMAYDAFRPLLPGHEPQSAAAASKPAENHLWNYSPEALSFIAYGDEFLACQASRTIYEMSTRWAGSPPKRVKWIGSIKMLPTDGRSLFLTPVAAGYENVELFIGEIPPKQISSLQVGDQVLVNVEISQITVLGAIGHLCSEEKKPDPKPELQK